MESKTEKWRAKILCHTLAEAGIIHTGGCSGACNHSGEISVIKTINMHKLYNVGVISITYRLPILIEMKLSY